ncbi:MAG: DUF2764 family protein [Bacteroidales bacterium]|nr:DUF2764 family protein [Bacteroidales bacterium]
MSGRNYYYLVAGLPDLVMEQSKVKSTLQELLTELAQYLHPADYRLVERLFWPIDHGNVYHLLLKTGEPFKSGGRFSAEELEEEIKNPVRLPRYVANFIQAYKNNEPIWPHLSWEDQLTALYLDEMCHSTNLFMRQWFTFERNLRNVLAALTARKFKLEVNKVVVGDDDISRAIARSQSRDFGISDEFPQVEKIIQIFETTQLAEREKSIDVLRWNYLDELNTFNYFSIEVILAFLIKLQIVQRWMALDPKAGVEIFRRLLKDLENSYEFPKEFKK